MSSDAPAPAVRQPTDQPTLTSVTYPKTALAPNEKYAVVRNCRSVGADIELCYDIQGPEDGEPIILVMGLNAQMVLWPQEFVDALVAQGFKVVRFDNRDTGHSRHFDVKGTTSICCLVCCDCCLTPYYTLEDMAADTIALADFLGFDKYHVAGQSMGGFISQHVAAMDAGRVKSCSLFYTSSGDKSMPQPSLGIKLDLAAEPKDDSRAAYIENFLTMTYKVGFAPKEKKLPNGEELWSDEWVSDLWGKIYDRCLYVDGFTRQATAILTQKPRNELLKKLSVPVLVIHGKQDRLVDPAHGKQLHELIPNSRFMFEEYMGHGIMPGHCSKVARAIAAVARGQPHPSDDVPAAPASAAAAAAVAPEPVSEHQEPLLPTADGDAGAGAADAGDKNAEIVAE